VIAMTAIEHDLVLLHNDRDFELMGSADPALRLYRV
jgi:predicted nucleic acid-binding protein